MSTPTHSPARDRPWLRRMTARDRNEPHRASTPLELLFDLSFVVAVAIAAAELHHGIADDHAATGVLGFTIAFFAIWWAWMGFTWFASAFDTDDVPYRLCVLVQIAGVLILASGIPRLAEGENLVAVLGYSVMRLGLVAMWLRAWRNNTDGSPAALRYAIGIVAVQVCWWLSLLVAGEPIWLVVFVVLVTLDISVPIWAERAGPTPWHRSHIVERYGLFTIIMLGESILATVTAFSPAFEDAEQNTALILLAAAALVIVFSMWWLYFEQPSEELLDSNRTAIPWGYGHLFIFASAAAVGAGLQVAVDYDTDQTAIGGILAASATAVPVAVYLLCLSVLYVQLHANEPIMRLAFPATTALVLLSVFSPAPIHLIAVLLAGLVTVSVISRHRAQTPELIIVRR